MEEEIIEYEENEHALNFFAFVLLSVKTTHPNTELCKSSHTLWKWARSLGAGDNYVVFPREKQTGQNKSWLLFQIFSKIWYFDYKYLKKQGFHAKLESAEGCSIINKFIFYCIIKDFSL